MMMNTENMTPAQKGKITRWKNKRAEVKAVIARKETWLAELEARDKAHQESVADDVAALEAEIETNKARRKEIQARIEEIRAAVTAQYYDNGRRPVNDGSNLKPSVIAALEQQSGVTFDEARYIKGNRSNPFSYYHPFEAAVNRAIKDQTDPLVNALVEESRGIPSHFETQRDISALRRWKMSPDDYYNTGSNALSRVRAEVSQRKEELADLNWKIQNAIHEAGKAAPTEDEKKVAAEKKADEKRLKRGRDILLGLYNGDIKIEGLDVKEGLE